MSVPPRARVYTRYPFGVRFGDLRPEQEATLPVGFER